MNPSYNVSISIEDYYKVLDVLKFLRQWKLLDGSARAQAERRAWHLLTPQQQAQIAPWAAEAYSAREG